MLLSRYWSMLITQIPCAKGMLQTADPGCRQYLTGITGTLQSFNFANTNNPQLLAGKHYHIHSHSIFTSKLIFWLLSSLYTLLRGVVKYTLEKLLP